MWKPYETSLSAQRRSTRSSRKLPRCPLPAMTQAMARAAVPKHDSTVGLSARVPSVLAAAPPSASRSA